MKKISLISLFLMLILASLFIFSSCEGKNRHVHEFGEWKIVKAATCTSNGEQKRYCSCGEKDRESIPATGHTEVVDPAVSATCTTDGKTEGKHCSVCNEVLVAQTDVKATGHTEVIDAAVSSTCTIDGKTEGKHCSVCNEVLVAQIVTAAPGHTEVVDAAVPATCTTNGKTEGKHCSVCNETIVAQTEIVATGHKYNDGVVTTKATCNKNGIKTYTCKAPGCGDTYTESFELQKYTATELYNQSVKYVGEIVVYDRYGAEYALGTAFVISSDGKIVTNYHVIENAYSAEITINNVKYTVASVLAYDANIDLAVLKIDASGLPYATVCKLPVNVGETVYAIGSSRGMTNTYSQGIITYADRVVDGVSHVQHDASITHGNSGGPLINVYGEVIGINTWGISDSQNLNFAVFADELDNLTYGTAVTLAELFYSQTNAYEQLIEWVYDNYNQTYSDGEILSVERNDEGFIFSISYDIVGEYLYVDVYRDDIYFAVYFYGDPTEYEYDLEFDIDYSTYYLTGTVNANTYTDTSNLLYDKYTGPSNLEGSAVELAQAAMNSTLDFFNTLTAQYDLGMSVATFGFLSFGN